MLRLPKFEFLRPTTVAETVDLLAAHGEDCKVIAGGTDLLPNMKHRLFEPKVVIGLSAVEELKGIARTAEGGLAVGAMATLLECESSALLQSHAPGLAQAARAVAGPSQRAMATLGGNICLDTRCVWYNQTHFWRKSLGYCLKKDGTECHVVAGGTRCVAAASNDTATMLTALEAQLLIRSQAGSRNVPIREFYKPDGMDFLKLEPAELLVQVILPPSSSSRHSGYAKLRTRNSIDFPKLSVAASYETDSEGRMTNAELVLSAIAATPRRIRGIGELAAGRSPDDPDFLAEAGELARKRIKPLTNIDGDADYRRDMVPVFVKRAFGNAQRHDDGEAA